jgi:hypothetical protein
MPRNRGDTLLWDCFFKNKPKKMKTEKQELPKYVVMIVDSKKLYPAYSRSEARRQKILLSKGKVGAVVVRKMVVI